MTAVFVLVPSYVYAESADDKVAFAVSLDETLGHFWAVEQNLNDGNTELALVHAAHPISELYKSMEPDLVAANPSFDNRVQRVLMNLPNEISNANRMQALSAIDEAKAIVKQARSIVVGSEWDSAEFKTRVVSELLDIAVHEYEEAVSNGKIVEMAEFQDGSAFVWRSQQILDTMRDQVDADRLDVLFAEVERSYNARADPHEVEKLIRNVIDELDNTSSESGTVPSWIKQVARAWATGDITEQEFLNAIEYLVQHGIITIQDGSRVVGELDRSTLTIGFIPVEKAEELTPQAEELVKFLEQQMPGTTIEIEIPTNYETIIEGMRFGHIDAAFMDTGPGWITHTRTGAEAVLAEVVDGKINYQATVWTRADDYSIESISDTVGKRVAFTSITGSSGFVRPMGTLVTDGHIDIEGNDIIALQKALSDSFDQHTFAGGYKAALELLLNGNVDVAFGSDIAAQRYLEPQDQARLKPVEYIGPVPSHVFMVSPDVPASQKEALVDALVKLNRDDNNQILQNLYGADALLPTTTEMHIGDFGRFIDALTGLDQLILDKHNVHK